MRIQRALAIAAAAVVAGAGLAAVAAPASAAPANQVGFLTITDPAGNAGTAAAPAIANTENLLIQTSAPCPAGDRHISRIANVVATNPADQAEADRWNNLGAGRNLYGRTIAGFATLNTTAFPTSVLQSIATTVTPPLQFVPGTYDIELYCVQGAVSAITAATPGFGGQITFVAGNQAYVSTSIPATATTTDVTLSTPGPIFFGDSVTITATVSPAAAAGSVVFTANGSPIPGQPAGGTPVSGGVATLTTNALPVGNPTTVNANFTGGPGFANSTDATPPSIVVQAVPNSDTQTVLTVNPTTGAAFQNVSFSATVTDTTAPITTPTGSCAFKSNGTTFATVALTGGVCATTNSSFGNGTFAFTVDYLPTGPFNPSTSNTVTATYAGYVCDPLQGDQCVDPQTVTVTVPRGALVISTPYTSAAPFELPDLVLRADGTAYDISAPFGTAAAPEQGVTITDTRAGALGFTAQIASTDFASGLNTISNSLLGFTGLSPQYIAGNAINAGNPVATTDRPAGSISTAPATFATGTGPGSVYVIGTLSLTGVPTSTIPGDYTATVTFTIS